MRRIFESVNAGKILVIAVALIVSPMAWPAVKVQESPVAELQTNSIREGNFSSAQMGGPPPKPWRSSQGTDKTGVTVETPPGRPETERWVRLVDDNDRENANLRQTFAPVASGRFQARLISNKEGGRLFFNLGTGAASKPEERAVQLSIDSDGALVTRSEPSHKTSLRIKTGEVYWVRCDFDRVKDGKALRIVAELVEESTQAPSRVEAEIETRLAISTVRVTSIRSDTGVDYYVTDLSLTSR
jgi:hypothetical protein